MSQKKFPLSKLAMANITVDNEKSTINSFHVLTHLLVVRKGLGVLLVFAKISYGFLTVNSNIWHSQF